MVIIKGTRMLRYIQPQPLPFPHLPTRFLGFSFFALSQIAELKKQSKVPYKREWKGCGRVLRKKRRWRGRLELTGKQRRKKEGLLAGREGFGKVRWFNTCFCVVCKIILPWLPLHMASVKAYITARGS